MPAAAKGAVIDAHAGAVLGVLAVQEDLLAAAPLEHVANGAAHLVKSSKRSQLLGARCRFGLYRIRLRSQISSKRQSTNSSMSGNHAAKMSKSPTA
jgi:hypothetical protein